MNKVLIIDNPNAGRKKAIKYKKAVIKFLLRQNAEFKSIEIDELDNDYIKNADYIIAIGGDGTVNKIIPYIINTEKVLGIIPCGTANLLAAKLGIPSSVNRALEVIEKNKISQIDTLKINNGFSILRIGFGYDSDIIGKTPQSLKNKFGYFAYFLAGILFALRLKQKKYTIFHDNKKLSVLATCIIVANAGNMFKNLVSISNNCELKDGLFDVFILKVKNPIMFFFEFLMILFNRKLSNSKAMYFKTDDIKINIIPKSVKVFSNSDIC